MDEIMQVMEWAHENFEIFEIRYDRGCKCFDWNLTFVYEDYTCTVRGISYLDGDVSDVVYISNDFDGREEFEYKFSVNKADDLFERVRNAFKELVDDEVTFVL